MAEINLYFGADGHVIVPVTAEFSRMALRENDVVVCTLPAVAAAGPEQFESVAKQLRDVLHGRGLKGVQVILVAQGVTLQAMSDEELAELGLRRIG